ncbi:bglM [Symbiodinium natans]|uniref:beta-glucosidase n=1 Tax=Symbiodinium natans TaxID=878477 RepID=A0A812MIJ3_9DINO|nr:bglM [Symbiodinium natans]
MQMVHARMLAVRAVKGTRTMFASEAQLNLWSISHYHVAPADAQKDAVGVFRPTAPQACACPCIFTERLLSGAAASKNDEEPLHIPHYHGPFLRHWQHAYDLASRTLANLSPWQRVRLVHGKGWRGWQLTPGFYVGTTVGHAPENIPWLKMQDSGNGFRSMLPSTVGTTIVWPSPLALAATWDIQAVGEQAGALATEFRGKGANAMLGPGLNVNRIARGGRNFEYLPGEDPFLGATLTRSFIFHLQRKGVMAVLKHFGFNEQETNRNWVSSIVDERTAWELYYPPFEAGIDVGAAAIMCSYNKVPQR